MAALMLAALATGCDGGEAGVALYINEFMADNETTDVDGSGGSFPDWIELYNDGEEDLSLDGFTITDDLAAPTMWSLPPLTIAAGGFLILFADGDTTASDHLPFKLSASGEEIGLYQVGDEMMLQIDAVAYGELPADHSAARSPDASENWVTTDQPTPGTSNGG